MTKQTVTPAAVPCSWPVRHDKVLGTHRPCGEPAVARTIGIILPGAAYAGWTIEHAASRAGAHCQAHADLHRDVYSHPGHAFLTLPL